MECRGESLESAARVVSARRRKRSKRKLPNERNNSTYCRNVSKMGKLTKTKSALACAVPGLLCGGKLSLKGAYLTFTMDDIFKYQRIEVGNCFGLMETRGDFPLSTEPCRGRSPISSPGSGCLRQNWRPTTLSSERKADMCILLTSQAKL